MQAIRELQNGLALSDVEAVVISTADKAYMIKTASEIGLKPFVSQGEEKELRKGNTIYAQNIKENIIKGYDLDMTDVMMHPEVMAIIDGGAVVNDGEGAFKEYSSPVMGTPTIRPLFTMDIYCADKDTSGETKGYMMIKMTGCRGTPCEWALKDGDFYSPKYTIKSRPAFGVSPMDVEAVTALPAVTPVTP